MRSLWTICLLLVAGNFPTPVGYSWKPLLQAHPDARYQSAHFILTAPAGQDIGRLLDELERARREVMAFGLVLPNQIKARSYRTSAGFVRGSGGASFHLAFAVGERIHLQPLSVLLKRGDLAQALRHELTHVALAEAARRGLPRWVNEGTAMLVAGEMQPDRKRFRRLVVLEDSLARCRSYQTLRAAYGASRYLVDRLIAERGRSRITGLLHGVAAGGRFDNRFRELMGVGVRRWGDSVLAK